MAGRLSQLPLPWIPDGAAEVARGVGLESLPGRRRRGVGARPDDVLLGRRGRGGPPAGGGAAGGAEGGDPAADRGRVRDRHRDAVAVAGRVPARRAGRAGGGQAGAEGAVEADGGADTEDRELAAAGKSQAAIAAATGVSTFAVRTALGRVPARRPAPGAPAAADGAAGGEPAWAQDELPVLPGPVPRDGERALARFGLLGEGAAPVFTAGARYPLAGLLLALPALAGTGLIQAARDVYGRLTDGFYGLETMLVLLVFLALLREPRAEGATRVPPAALGRVLGLDRAPEVKTIEPQARRARRRGPGRGAAAGYRPPPRRRRGRTRSACSTSTGTPAPTSAPVRCRRCTSRG